MRKLITVMRILMIALGAAVLIGGCSGLKTGISKESNSVDRNNDTMKTNFSEEDLEGVPLLLTSHKCSFRAMLMADLERKGITAKTALEITNKGILKQFARNGLGITFIPDMVAEDELKEGSLKRLNWKGEDFPIFSQIFIHKDKHISPAIRTFTEKTIQVLETGNAENKKE